MLNTKVSQDLERKIQLFILYLLNIFKVVWRSTFSRWTLFFFLKYIFILVDFYSTGKKKRRNFYIWNIFLFFHSKKIFNKIKMFFKNKERKIKRYKWNFYKFFNFFKRKINNNLIFLCDFLIIILTIILYNYL